jgi:hypothetical protein
VFGVYVRTLKGTLRHLVLVVHHGQRMVYVASRAHVTRTFAFSNIDGVVLAKDEPVFSAHHQSLRSRSQTTIDKARSIAIQHNQQQQHRKSPQLTRAFTVTNNNNNTTTTSSSNTTTTTTPVNSMDSNAVLIESLPTLIIALKHGAGNANGEQHETYAQACCCRRTLVRLLFSCLVCLQVGVVMFE